MGEFVRNGQEIGETNDLREEVLQKFIAPMTSVVLVMFTNPVRISGETLLMMGKTEKKSVGA